MKLMRVSLWLCIFDGCLVAIGQVKKRVVELIVYRVCTTIIDLLPPFVTKELYKACAYRFTSKITERELFRLSIGRIPSLHQ